MNKYRVRWISFLPYYFNILDETVETQGRNSIISLFTLKGTYFCTLSALNPILLDMSMIQTSSFYFPPKK